MPDYSWTLESGGAAPGAAAEDVAEFFGQDLLHPLALTAGGDYVLIDGERALKQSVYHRLLVSPGEYALRPEFGAGLAAAVKRRITPAEIDALTLRITEQLLTDARVQKIVEIQTESTTIGDSPALRVYVKVLAVGQEIRLPMTYSERV